MRTVTFVYEIQDKDKAIKLWDMNGSMKDLGVRMIACSEGNLLKENHELMDGPYYAAEKDEEFEDAKWSYVSDSGHATLEEAISVCIKEGYTKIFNVHGEVVKENVR